MYPHIPGRRRSLDPPKKLDLCERVAQGATVEEAAEAVGVSLRTVQRARKWDEHFDHELRLSLQAPPDPLKLMQSAARAHWRAAAWLLEREDPERYARRAPTSCSPIHFEQALELVVEAALQAARPEDRSEVYQHVKAACQQAFTCAFPAYGPWDKPKRRSFPAAPLITAERRNEALDPARILADLTSVDQAPLRLPGRTNAPSPRPLSSALQAIREKYLLKAAEHAVSSAPPAPSRHEANGVLRREPHDQQAIPATTDDNRQPDDGATSSVATTIPFCREKHASRQNTPPFVERPAAQSTTSAPPVPPTN